MRTLHRIRVWCVARGYHDRVFNGFCFIDRRYYDSYIAVKRSSMFISRLASRSLLYLSRPHNNAGANAMQCKANGIIFHISHDACQKRSILALSRRSALFGNVQGTAHITWRLVSGSSHNTEKLITYLAFTIRPEIYAASDEMVQCCVCGLVKQHSAQAR